MENNENPEGLAAFDSFIGRVQDQILEPIVALIALAAFLVFAWGVIEFILGAGDEERRRTGRRHMMWGIVGLVIVFGASIIVRILTNIVS